jgi:hypothetical protein
MVTLQQAVQQRNDGSPGPVDCRCRLIRVQSKPLPSVASIPQELLDYSHDQEAALSKASTTQEEDSLTSLVAFPKMENSIRFETGSWFLHGGRQLGAQLVTLQACVQQPKEMESTGVSTSDPSCIGNVQNRSNSPLA